MHGPVHGEGEQELVVVDRVETADIALVGHPMLDQAILPYMEMRSFTSRIH